MKRAPALLLAAVLLGAAPGVADEPLDAGAAGESLEDAGGEDVDPADELPPLVPVPAERVDRVLGRVLGASGHEFCRDAERSLERGEAALCRFAEPAAARCPGFAAACRRANVGSPAPPKPRARALAGFAALLEAVGYVLFAALLLGAAIVLFTGLRRLAAAKGGRASAPPPELDAPGAPDAGTSPLLDRDVERRLARARTLAANGEPGLALSELHAAVILRLDARGAISAGKDRTNGDYARELAREPELRAAFRELSRAVEAVQFGGRRADGALFERTFSRAQPLLASLLLALTALFSTVGCDGVGSGASAHARCGTGAHGFSALCALLAEEGVTVKRRYRKLESIDADVGVLVVLPNELPEPDRSVIHDWVLEGGTLVLTTEFSTLEATLMRSRAGAPCEGPALLTNAPEGESAAIVGVSATLERSAGVPYATCEGKTVVDRLSYGGGSVVSLPNDDLLTNAGLAAGDNARWLLPLVPRDRGVVELVGTFTGKSSETPIQSLRAAGLWPWILQLAALGLAFALFRGTPFGRRHESPPAPRRAFREHVEALGERWADARDARAALRAYGALALELFRERVPSALQSSVAALTPALAERSGKSEAAVARVLAEARLAQEGDDSAHAEAEQLATVRELGRLLSETGGTR